jgi:hypothetical protein
MNAESRDLQFDSFSPALSQVLPHRILGLDQRQPFRPRPRLDLLFSCDGVSDLMEGFVISETIDVVSLREPVDFTALMLEHTPVEAIRYSCVEVKRSAGHDVDVIGFGSQLQIPRLCSSFAKRMSRSARVTREMVSGMNGESL